MGGRSYLRLIFYRGGGYCVRAASFLWCLYHCAVFAGRSVGSLCYLRPGRVGASRWCFVSGHLVWVFIPSGCFLSAQCCSRIGCCVVVSCGCLAPNVQVAGCLSCVCFLG